MPPSEDMYPPEPASVKRNRAARNRTTMAQQRAGTCAAINGIFERSKWLLRQELSANSASFGARLRLREDMLREKARDVQEAGHKDLYEYSTFSPFDERIGFLRPVYALPRHSSTTAPREPS